MKTNQKWVDRWTGFYDAVTQLHPQKTMKERMQMADDYIGIRNIRRLQATQSLPSDSKEAS